MSMAFLMVGVTLAAVAVPAPSANSGAGAPADGGAAVAPSARAKASTVPRPTVSRTSSALDRRVALLVRELDLDDSQRLKVRALLVGQREQVLRVWDDESLPSGLRVKQTQAISERTQDEIRALLTDEQKQKYSKPRPAGAAAGGSPAELATWMDKVDGR
jgi:hypothetical protein